MLLVYAMTRATENGWGTTETIGLLTASAALIVAFVVIELRSKAPLLPMRIFRLRTLTGANVTAFLLGTAVFSQFFLGTLYMQQVLHYSAIETGVAYLPLTLTIIVLANVAQNAGHARSASGACSLPGSRSPRSRSFCSRSCRPTATTSWISSRPSCWARVGLAFTFIPMTIAALMGVQAADAGVASGLLNTSQQIGGAIGLAAASTIATTFTAQYVGRPPGRLAPRAAAALTHGFQIAFYVARRRWPPSPPCSAPC